MPGEVAGDKIVQARDTHRLAMLDLMRSDGFVPLLDLDPVWEQRWIKDDVFGFIYTMQGVYVGEEKAWQVEGVLNGRMIPSTLKNK